MFGRSKEILDYTVRPTEEGAEILAQQALERIEAVDGVDYLDGYELPPDNEELWDLRPVTGYHHRQKSIYDESGRLHEWQNWTEVDRRHMSVTNSHARTMNIYSISTGNGKLHKKWEEVQIEWDKPKEGSRQGLLRRLGSVLINPKEAA